MIDVQEKKNKIISFLETSGPSLPVRIAKAIGMDPVFASAIASELLGSKQIKTSYMKIGASPLYLLPGQEQRLEEYTEHLKSIEKEAYLKLKEKKLMKDGEESPAIRVALRNIKDFAIPFKFQEKIMWKYAFVTDEEIEKLLSGPKQKIESEAKEPRVKIEPEPKKEELGAKEERVEQKPAAKLEEPKEVPKAWEVKREEIKQIKEESKKVEDIFAPSEAEEPEPEFLTEIKKFLKHKNIEFIEEIRTEKKEVVATVSITSQLGKINFLLIAKNKKTATKDEIDAATQMATKNKMPCLLIIRKTPSRPIQKIIDKNHLIKLEIME